MNNQDNINLILQLQLLNDNITVTNRNIYDIKLELDDVIQGINSVADESDALLDKAVAVIKLIKHINKTEQS
jgi:hypothetical protein